MFNALLTDATRRRSDEDASTPVTRVRADDIERLVCATLAKHLANPQWVMETLCDEATAPNDRVYRTKRAHDLSQILVANEGSEKASPECVGALKGLLDRVTLGKGIVTIALRTRPITRSEGDDFPRLVAIEIPVHLHQTGCNKPIILQAADEAYRDPDLIALVADARRWAQLLLNGKVGSVDALTRREGNSQGTISKALPLAWLAPDITTAILEGRQPRSLTASKLRRVKALPLAWDEQRKLLGFPAH